MALKALEQHGFLDHLHASATYRANCGVHAFPGFIPADEAKTAFLTLSYDANFPWDLKPKLYGEKLSQHT
jgi:hypothetical protein